jgi:hypothetical protein
MNLFCLVLQGTRDSVVVIVTRLAGRPWQLRNRGSFTGRGNMSLFSDGSRPAEEPINIVGTGGTSPETRVHEASHSSPYSSEVKNEWSCISIHPYFEMTWTEILQSQARQPGFITWFEFYSLL